MPASPVSSDPLLPNPPGVVGQFFADHPRVIDLGILAVYAGANLLLVLLSALDALSRGKSVLATYRDDFLLPIGEHAHSETVSNLMAAAALLAIVAGGALLLWRRSRPALALIATVLLGFVPMGIPAGGLFVAACFFMYAVPVYESVRRAWISFAIVALLFSGYVILNRPGGSEAGHLVVLHLTSLGPYLIAVLIGINIGGRRRYLDALVARAEQLALERDQRAQLAVAGERARISREMHDIVAHSLSVMIALSDGASRAVGAAPREAAEAMRASAATGRQALTEMRRALGMLRDSSGAELAPQPGLAELDELVAGFADAGLRVTATVDADIDDEGLELTVYRLVQEGLTNALRYAGIGATAEVTVAARAGAVRVRVRDHGTPPVLPAPPPGQGSGQGLVGLRERVRAFSGTLSSAPAADGPGWLLAATLPLTGHTVPDTETGQTGEPGKPAEPAATATQRGSNP